MQHRARLAQIAPKRGDVWPIQLAVLGELQLAGLLIGGVGQAPHPDRRMDIQPIQLTVAQGQPGGAHQPTSRDALIAARVAITNPPSTRWIRPAPYRRASESASPSPNSRSNSDTAQKL